MTDFAAGDPPAETSTEIDVPASMLEPAQALDKVMGSGISQAATATATTTFHQNIIVNQQKTGPGFFVRAIWYLFIGWWLTGFALGFAWVCSLTVVLLPVAYVIVNKIPTILTLRPRSVETQVAVDGAGNLTITTGGAAQLPFWQRALWFLFVGWWACALAMTVAYVASLTVVLLPVGLMIFNRVPAVMTLQRN